MPDMNKPMTAQQVADFLQVHLYTVQTWAREGTLPGRKLDGAGWRFDPETVRAFTAPKFAASEPHEPAEPAAK